MDPSEIEFIAEFERVRIIPSFTIDRVFHLISGDVGPFRAGFPQTVPLWLAVYWKQQIKCQIIPPEWLNVETLEQKKEEEKRSRYFTKMPSKHYMEIANILLDTAGDDIPRSFRIGIAIKDIWDIRISKLRSSVEAFIKNGGRYAQLDHLTQMEINSIRPLLPDALNVLQKLTENKVDESNNITSQIHSLTALMNNTTLTHSDTNTMVNLNDTTLHTMDVDQHNNALESTSRNTTLSTTQSP